MAAVLLRKCLATDGLWGALPAATQAGVKAGLLHSLEHEAAASVRGKIGHVVAEAARVGAGPGAALWPELLPTIFSLARAPAPAVRISALKAFTAVVEFAGEDAIAPHAAPLAGTLPALLADADASVGVAALAVFCVVVAHIEGPALTAYTSLVPAVVATLERSFAADEQLARDALEVRRSRRRDTAQLRTSRPPPSRPRASPPSAFSLFCSRSSTCSASARTFSARTLMPSARP
jgi:hypothetical protein